MVMTLAALLGCLTIYVALVRPTQERLVDARETLNVLHQKHLSEETAKQTQQTLERFWQDLPTQQEFTHLGVRINTIAKHNEVSIPGMEYRVASSKNKTGPQGSMTFRASGSYKAIRRFIHQLEKTGPYLIIEKLTAERTKQTDDLIFTLQIGTFFRPSSANGTAKEMAS